MAWRSDTEVRAKIRTMLESVTGYGEVMDYWGELPAWAGKQGVAATPFWTIRRTGVVDAWPPEYGHAIEGAEVEETTTYEIAGYMPHSLKAGSVSEPVWEALVDAVRALFRNDINLDGYVYEASLFEYSSGETGFVMLSGTGAVCHEAILTLRVRQFAQRT